MNMKKSKPKTAKTDEEKEIEAHFREIYGENVKVLFAPEARKNIKKILAEEDEE
jgi:hypothetical protein